MIINQSIRVSWLLVMLLGLALSGLQYYHLETNSRELLTHEINQRSVVKLDMMQANLREHLDITSALMTFMRSEISSHGMIGEEEARTYLAGLQSEHPDELESVILWQGPNISWQLLSDGSVHPLSSFDDALLHQPQASIRISLLDDQRIQFSITEQIDGAWRIIACKWNLAPLIQQAIENTPAAGLDIRLDIAQNNSFVPIFTHSSRAREDGGHATTYQWQREFEIAGTRFRIHTGAIPELTDAFSSHTALFALFAGLLITLLLTYFTFMRVRAHQILRQTADERTRRLSDKQATLAAIIDHARDTILVVNEQGSVLLANPAASTMFGYPEDEWRTIDIRQLMPPRLRAIYLKRFGAKLDGGSHRIIGRVHELEAMHKNGTTFPCEITMQAFHTADERRFSVVIRDLSRIKKQQWVQQSLLGLRTASQQSASLNSRLKAMLEPLLTAPWPIDAAAVYLTQADQLWLNASQGWSAAEKRQHMVINDGDCFCNQPIERAHPQIAGDNIRQPNGPHLCLDIDIDGQRLGLLYLHLVAADEPEDMFTDFFQQMLEILATTINRERTRQTLEDSESKHRQLVEASPVGIIIQSGGAIRYANRAAHVILGFTPDDPLSDQRLNAMIYQHDQAPFEALVKNLQQGNVGELTTLRLRHHQGEIRWTEISGVPIVFEGQPAEQLLIHDISDRKQAEDQLVRLSYSDELTGLPNRRLYIDRLEQACSLARRRNNSFCLLFIDLDRFKVINDTQGHACGDQILKTVAHRIQGALRASDTAARMGGDEFAVLLPDTEAASAQTVAGKLISQLQNPIIQNHQEFNIGASIGLASFPEDGTQSDALLNHADSAMYFAKQNRLDIHRFTRDMEEAAKRRTLLEGELANAAERGELQLFYQAQYKLSGDGVAIAGFESLIRWHHPELGMISPGEFIPIAEESGLIPPITAWVISESSRQAKAWARQGLLTGRIGVNVSAGELMQPGLAEDILEQIRKAGAKPEWIEIEITETAAMNQPETAIAIMRKLVEGGVSIAIDDFGTGYSSLAYLKQLPAQLLKIDIAFIRHLPDDAEDAVIVRTIIAMAHSLGMQVIAEGVEHDEQLEFLKQECCDAVQGYLLAKPEPADAVTAMLQHPANTMAA